MSKVNSEQERAEFLLKQMEARLLLSPSPPTHVTHIKIAKVDIIYPLGYFVYKEHLPHVSRDGKIQKEYTREEVIQLIIDGLSEILCS